MEVPDFFCLLKQLSSDSEVWWDSSPTLYAPFKLLMLKKYPDMFSMIENLLPDHFSESEGGISGATSNPYLITQAVLDEPRRWRNFIAGLPAGMTEADTARHVYDQMISIGAAELHPLWVASRHQRGWFSVQIEGAPGMNEKALVARGLQLARLAPNIMIKVPGSEQGYRAIEQLVAHGCSVNNTFCFTVSQVSACLKAIHAGQLRARLQGVSTERARYVISFMIGRLGAEREFERQASQRRLRLTGPDRRWAEIAVYQAMQALLRRHETPARLLLCSLKTDIDACGREHCWHLQRTGYDTTLYTLTPNIIDFMIRRQQQSHPIIPATEWVAMPKRVLQRLMAIPYFNQAYFEGDQASCEFSSHPAFVAAAQHARDGQETLLTFVKGAGTQRRPYPRPYGLPVLSASERTS